MSRNTVSNLEKVSWASEAALRDAAPMAATGRVMYMDMFCPICCIFLPVASSDFSTFCNPDRNDSRLIPNLRFTFANAMAYSFGRMFFFARFSTSLATLDSKFALTPGKVFLNARSINGLAAAEPLLHPFVVFLADVPKCTK